MPRVRQLLQPRLAGRMSTFKRGFLSTFMLDAVARGLSAVTTVLLVRGLGVGSFAYVVLFLNVGQFAGSAATGGIRMRYMRMEAERVSRGIDEPSSFFAALSGSIMLVWAGAALAWLLATAVGAGDSSAQRISFIAITALYTTGHASIELAMYHHQAHLSFTKAGILGVARSAVLCIVALAATVGLMGSGEAVAGWSAASVLAVAAWLCAPLAWSTRRSTAGMEGRFGFGRESNWLTLYYLVSAGFSYINIFLVAALLSQKDVASYGAALRYFAIVTGPMPALLAVLRVRTSQHDVVDSPRVQTEFLLNWAKRATLPLFAMVGLAAALAPFVIPVIDGGRYPQSVAVFQILLVVALAMYATMPASNLLMAQRRYDVLAITYSIFLAVDAALAIAAGKIWGLIGITVVAAVLNVADSSVVAFLALRPRSAIAAQPEPEPLAAAASERDRLSATGS